MDLDCYFYDMKCVIARLLSDFLDSISQRRVGQTCSHFMCIVKRVADNWTLFGDSFEQKWISIENGSSKLTHSLFIAPFKNNIHSPWVGVRPFRSGSPLFLYEETLCFSISLSIGHTAMTQHTQQISKACWSEYLLCAHGFLILLYRCGSVYLNILS